MGRLIEHLCNRFIFIQHWTELLSSEQPTLVESEYCCKNVALRSRLKVLLKSTGHLYFTQYFTQSCM